MLNKRILAVPAIVGLLVLGGAGLAAASVSVCAKEGLVHGANVNGARPAGTGAVLAGSQGPVGPRGPAGAIAATGPQGPTGMARDAGVVHLNPLGFYKEGLVGWRSMSRTGTGEYCLTPDATSTRANTSLLLSTGGPGGEGEGVAVWEGYCSTSPLELEIETLDLSGTASDGIVFEAVVPLAGTVGDAGVAHLNPLGFYKEGLVGWRSMSRTGTGTYCLTPDVASTRANTSLLLSTGGPGGEGEGVAVWEGYCSTSPLELKVETLDLSGTASDGISFEAVVSQTPVISPCSPNAANLIANPGAEAGPGTENDSVVNVPSWTATGTFTAAAYAWPDGDLSATTPGPTCRGENYFYGGNGSSGATPPGAQVTQVSTGTQVITLTQAGITTGKVTYVLSGWLGGYLDQGDDAALYLTWWSGQNAGGQPLSATVKYIAGFPHGLFVSTQIGPVTLAQRSDNNTDNTELLFRGVSGLVPAAARSAKLVLVMDRYVGDDNDGMADNLSLVLSGT